MSSMVCQGVQSCFEPLVFESCGLNHKINQLKPNQCTQIPLVLKQQENPCNPEEFDNENKNLSKNFIHNNNGDVGCCNFFQSLYDKNKQSNGDKYVYVHPLVKKYSSTLSLKSLEMCTESLGSETGNEFSFPLLPKTSEENHQIWRLTYKRSAKRVSGNTKFLPPLTSISDSDNVRVTPHHEGGRLVLKAATISPCNSYFQTERVDGRLRLCLVQDNSPTSKDVDINDECEQQEEEDEYNDDGENWVEDIRENSENVGCEMGIGGRPMPRWCKESEHENKGMPNWEPYWMPISFVAQ